jgi:hypothetical protein
LCGVAINRFGYTPAQFYDLTPLEYWYATKDYEESETAKIRPLAESIRMNLFYNHNLQVDRKHAQKDPKKFYKFPWEEIEQFNEQTTETIKQKALEIARAFGITPKNKNKN